MEDTKTGNKTAAKEEESIPSPLQNKVVEVHPIKRATGLTNDPEHEASFLFGDAEYEITVPISRTGKLIDPLTEDERRYFEEVDKKLNLKPGSTSIYGDENGNNMWIGYKIRIGKEPRRLDLSDPQDYIDYKVLLANKNKVARSWQERNDRKEYIYALVDEDDRQKKEASLADKRKRAYKHYGKIEDDVEEMKKFLKIYGKNPGDNQKVSFLQAEINNIIENDLDTYLMIAEDQDYEMRHFINQAIDVGAINRYKNEYQLPGGDPIGRSIDEVIDFLRQNKNQDIYLDIQAKIDASK